MLHGILARIVAFSPTTLVKLFNTLEQRLETFLEQHDIDVAGIKADIVTVEERAKAEIISIEHNLERDVADLKDRITEKLSNAAVIATIKAAVTATKTPVA